MAFCLDLRDDWLALIHNFLGGYLSSGQISVVRLQQGQRILMEKVISDIDLSQAISPDVCENYTTALEFINSNPDYSLMKFREIVSIVVNLIAKKSNISFENKNLLGEINELFESQLINHPLQQKLHKVRKLGNNGVHKEQNFEGAKQFQESRKIKLIEDANQARESVVSILEDVYSIIEEKSMEAKIKLSNTGGQDLREKLYDAYTSVCPKSKLKAGVICETILDEERFKSGIIVSSSFKAHIEQLKDNAINFYDASCKISASIDQHLSEKNLNKDEELVIQKYAETEALFKYANLAIYEPVETDIYKKSIGRMKAAADRGYASAEALYGKSLYNEKKYEEALRYLEQAAKKDETLALRILYFAYAYGNGVEIDHQKALEFLKKAISLGCPNSVATLGIAYHVGEITPKDDIEAERLLLESIEMGSAYGKRYYTIDFNNLTGKVAKQMAKQAEIIEKILNAIKPIKPQSKIGRNELCDCNSGRKYKKCCGRNL